MIDIKKEILEKFGWDIENNKGIAANYDKAFGFQACYNDHVVGLEKELEELKKGDLYLWDCINGSMEQFEDKQQLRRFVIDNFTEGTEAHIDIEALEIFKKVGDVALNESNELQIILNSEQKLERSVATEDDSSKQK